MIFLIFYFSKIQSSSIQTVKQSYDKFSDTTLLCTNPITTSKPFLKLQICASSAGKTLYKPENFTVTFTSTTSSKKIFEEGSEESSLSIINDEELYKYDGTFQNKFDKKTVHDTGKEVFNVVMYGAIGALKDEYKTSYKFETSVLLPFELVNKIANAKVTEGKIGEVDFKLSELQKKYIKELIAKSFVLPEKVGGEMKTEIKGEVQEVEEKIVN